MLLLLSLAFQSSITDTLLIVRKRVASNTEHHEATGYSPAYRTKDPYWKLQLLNDPGPAKRARNSTMSVGRNVRRVVRKAWQPCIGKFGEKAGILKIEVVSGVWG